MSKIVSAINTMINDAHKISKVIPNENVFYFLYADKYKWSIVQFEDDLCFLNYYPGEISFEEMAQMKDYEWSQSGIEQVVYSTNEFKTKEAVESFKELYLTVKEKLYGVDKVLNDIINDGDLPF